MAELSISGVTKRFGETLVLDDISLDVPDGKFAVLVGPSGCGKSTLLRLIAGLERADNGKIVMGESDVTEREPRDRDIAMVFQSYALYPHLTVRDNLAFGLKLRGTAAAEIDKRVRQVSEMLDIERFLARMPRELSGGQRQRVAMGRAIVRRPQMFLFDEPLSNLDAALRANVRVDIRRLHDELKTTSIYVTHDQVEAMTLADVMFVLNKGRIEQSGAPLEVYERPATRFVAAFLGSPAMNFLNAAVRDGALAIGEAWLDLPDGAFDVTAGDVTLGIRPHDLVPTEDGPLKLEVTLTEELGGDTYVYGQVGGQTVIARLDPKHRVKPGEVMGLAAPEYHLFDPESGRSLRC
jgi:sn-glycerol 3-phosphate transport system ATP-binding protein/multiple sugar transport system ATP-binding protein